jgi:predicted ArsR family transcriptional regulator
MTGKWLGNDKLRIMLALNRYGPMTCDEIERCLGLLHQTASARMCELWDKEFIRFTGERRMTRWGRMARVFRIRKKVKK